MHELSYEQKNIILDNFTRMCPGFNKDGSECRRMLQPTSTLCPGCFTRTELKKVFVNSYFEHFENKMCDVAKQTTFWCCIHPKIDSKLDELLTFCIHCITVDLVKSDVQIINSQDQ
jgi:hypothetical protein